MELIPAAKHHRALESFKQANPERWTEILRGSINLVSAKLAKEFASLLVHEGKLELLKETLARLINQHTASSELLLWFARDRTEDFVDILGPEVFRAMLTAMERDQFNEKRSNRLRDYILEDNELIGELTASADIEVIKDLTRTLQLSPVFDDMDKRSLLARLVKKHPAMQSLITGEQTKQDSTILVSWESLERRRAEYGELVQKKIPGKLEGNRDCQKLRRLARKPRIQGREGNAENPHAPKDELETQLVALARRGFFKREHGRRQHRHDCAGHQSGKQPVRIVHDPGRVGFRPGQGHHQLPFARRRGAAQPQARRRGGI